MTATANCHRLSPIQQYMLRLLLFGAGKTILHRGTLCEVVETHSQIRRLFPLVDEDGESTASPFWISSPKYRRARREERIRRQYVSGLRQVFSAPCYRGSPRPTHHPDTGEPLVTVPLESLIPPVVSDRCPDGLTKSPVQSSLSGARFKLYGFRWAKVGFHLVQNVPVTDTRRTTKGEVFSWQDVSRGLKRMRPKDWGMLVGMTEVVYRRQSPTQVANEWGLSTSVLKVYATRLRHHILAERGSCQT